jgi:tyrosinase
MKKGRTMPRMVAFLRGVGLLVVVTILVGPAILCAAPGAEHMIKVTGSSRQGTQVETLAVSRRPTALAGGRVNVTLSPGAALQGTTLASRLGALAPGDRIYLVLGDLAAQQQPGVLYHVFVDLPTDSAAEEGDPHYVGAVNFYNARPEGSASVFRSFDVTNHLRGLQERGLLSEQTKVTIIPSRGGPVSTDARPVIGRIELVVQAEPR